jgi:hypothetical protein
MSLDNLLLWLSAKGTGSWPQFRAAVEELHLQRQEAPEENDRLGSDLPVYHEASLSLQRLGHVEFIISPTGPTWRIVPPSVAFLPGESVRGLLCGARSVALIDHLQSVADVEILPVEGMPKRVILRGATEEAILSCTNELGLNVQEAAPITILCAIPGTRDPSTWYATSIPETPGWTVHRFSPEHLHWAAVSQIEALRARTGFFRFSMKYQRFYYLCWHGRSYKIPVQIGKYAIMRHRRNVLAYDKAHRILSVPPICRPPLLIERALTLCSGLLPRFNPATTRVEYVDVPPEVAQLSAQLLDQELK